MEVLPEATPANSRFRASRQPAAAAWLSATLAPLNPQPPQARVRKPAAVTGTWKSQVSELH